MRRISLTEFKNSIKWLDSSIDDATIKEYVESIFQVYSEYPNRSHLIEDNPLLIALHTRTPAVDNMLKDVEEAFAKYCDAFCYVKRISKPAFKELMNPKYFMLANELIRASKYIDAGRSGEEVRKMAELGFFEDAPPVPNPLKKEDSFNYLVTIPSGCSVFDNATGKSHSASSDDFIKHEKQIKELLIDCFAIDISDIDYLNFANVSLSLEPTVKEPTVKVLVDIESRMKLGEKDIEKIRLFIDNSVQHHVPRTFEADNMTYLFDMSPSSVWSMTSSHEVQTAPNFSEIYWNAVYEERRQVSEEQQQWEEQQYSLEMT